DPCSSAAQAAHRSNGIASVEIGRQHVGNRRKGGVGERSEPEEQRDQVQIHGENCRDEKQYPDPAKHNQRFSGHTERPASPNQVPRNTTAEKIADRKSTRLNSSHVSISYAVFCLKKKKKKT